MSNMVKLSCQTINSTSSTIMDLKLDVYKPANNTKRNCHIVDSWRKFFCGGDKSDVNIVKS
jgi:hypothetical protein